MCVQQWCAKLQGDWEEGQEAKKDLLHVVEPVVESLIQLIVQSVIIYVVLGPKQGKNICLLNVLSESLPPFRWPNPHRHFFRPVPNDKGEDLLSPPSGFFNILRLSQRCQVIKTKESWNQCVPWSLNDATKILTETNTFSLSPNFPKPKMRLFSETKFFKTRTDTYFPRPNFPKSSRDFFLRPKFRKLSRNWQKFRDRDFWISLRFFGRFTW